MLQLSSITFFLCVEKMRVLLVCTYSILNNFTGINVNTFLYCFFFNCGLLHMYDSIPFFLADDRSSSVPGKVNKASTATKRSIADSDEKSEAYKSIFTTHSSAKRPKEECSNWVTHTAYCFWNNDKPDRNVHPCFPSLRLFLYNSNAESSWSYLEFSLQVVCKLTNS